MVRQHNRLIESYFSLSLAEMRFIFHLAAEVRPEDNAFTTYEFSAADVGRRIGDQMLTYEEAEGLVMRLWRRELHMTADGGAQRQARRWITQADRDDKTGMIRVALSPDMQPYLLRLAEWTQARLDILTTLRSAYSVRLYLLGCKVRNQIDQSFTLTVEDLRARLEIPSDQYIRFFQLEEWVLRRPVAEINLRTDMNLSYQVERKGRSPFAVHFQVSMPPTKSLQNDGAAIAARIKKRRGRPQKSRVSANAVLEPTQDTPPLPIQSMMPLDWAALKAVVRKPSGQVPLS